MTRALAVTLVLITAPAAWATVGISKTAMGPAAIGGRVVYNIDVTRNAGDTNLVIIDTPPAGHQLLSVETPGGQKVDCLAAGSGPIGPGLVATCAVGATNDLQVTAQDFPAAKLVFSLLVTYRVSGAASSNVARATCTPATSCTQPSNTAVAAVAPADLKIDKHASATQVEPGATFDYTLKVTNNATSDLTGVTIHDALPPFVIVTSVDPPANVTITAGTVDIAPPLLMAGATTWILHAMLDKAAQGTVTNVATVRAMGGTPVPSPAASFDVKLGPAPLKLVKVVNLPTAKISDTIIYTLTATPNGPQPGPITLTDPLDAALKPSTVQVNGAPAACGALPVLVGGFTVSCGGDGRQLSVLLPAGQTLTAPLVVQVSATLLPSAPRSLQNVATLTDGLTPPGVQQASALVSVTDANAAGVSLQLTAGKVLAEKGDLVPFVANISVPEGAAPLPAPLLILGSTGGLRIGDVRVTAPDGTTTLVHPNEVGGALLVKLPPLPAGATVTAQVRARLNDRASPGSRESLSAQVSQDTRRLAGAVASVRVLADGEFDLGTLLGDVYRDDNGNGVRDRGERGIEGATVVMDDGLQAVTDAEGRYHLAAIVPGDRAIKVASHTLPPGSTFTTDETRIVLVTPGSLVKIDFGLKVPAPEPPAAGKATASTVLPELKLTDAGGLVYRLAGQSVPGARILVAGKEAHVDRKTGAWWADVLLRHGRTRVAEVTAWPDGRVIVASRDLFWVDRKEGGSLIVPRDAEPRLVLRFPPSALAEPTFTLEGTAQAPLAELTLAGQRLVPDAQGHFAVKLRVPEAGAGLAVDARFSDGFNARFDHVLTAGGDFLLLVGLAEGKIGFVQHDGAAQSTAKNGLYAEGRIKLYAKGRILGRWLLEGGLDLDTSQLESWRDLFRGDPQRIFRNVDPDRFYTVYGDASQTTQQAQTRGRLFVRIQFDKSELLFGNLQTGLTGTEFGRYARAATGGRISFVRASTDDPAGPPSTQVIVFGAWLQTSRAHDELRGTGGSLYYLSHKNVVEGSEQVRVEVRDKYSDRPVANVAERATADYEIDYLAGRVIMRDPLSAVGANPSLVRSTSIDGDSAFLVVDYEYLVDGDSDDGTVGARATQRVGPVRIGGTVANEFRSVGAGYTLLGADLQIDLKKWGVIIGEYAHSYGSLSSFSRSDDGGLSYGNAEGTLQATPAQRQGGAWKAEADLHGWGVVNFHPYARGVDQGFTDTAHAQDAGYIQWGADADASFWKLKLRLHYDERRYDQATYDLNGIATTVASETRRDLGAEIGGTFGSVGVRVGVRSERADDTDPLRAGHRTAIGARVDVKLVPRLTVYGAGQYAVEHGGGNGLLALDNSLAALGFISDLGWDTKLTTELNLHSPWNEHGIGALVSLKTALGPGRVIYGTVTLSQDRDDRLATTVAAGGRERVTDRQGNARAILFAEDQFRDGPLGTCVARIGCDDGGRAHVLATGLDVPISKRFVFGATFERGTVQPSGSPFSLAPGTQPLERTAGTLYASYGGDRLRLQARGELREDEQPGVTGSPLQWLASAMGTYRPHKDFTLRGKLFYSVSAPTGGATQARSAEATVGFAWRPSFTDRIALLGRYTFLDEFSPQPQALNAAVDPLSGQPLDLRERSHVMSLAADGRIVWRFSLGEKIAAKYMEDPTLNTAAWYILWVNRVSFHVTRRWDAVVEYRLLTVPGTSITHGVSLEANVIVVGHLRIGAGWNFADFSDNELTLGRGSEKGFFVRAQGFY